jgi:hypothetical protein
VDSERSAGAVRHHCEIAIRLRGCEDSKRRVSAWTGVSSAAPGEPIRSQSMGINPLPGLPVDSATSCSWVSSSLLTLSGVAHL